MTIRRMITLSQDMSRRLAEAAAEEGVSMSEVVRRALKSRFEACADDENLVRDLRAFRAAEFKRRPPEQTLRVSEAVDVLTQMQMDPEKALTRCIASVKVHPDATAEDLITLALKVDHA